MRILPAIIRSVAAGSLMCATAALAADPVYPSSGPMGYGTAREARAARSEARRERDEDPARLERNRFSRCDALPQEEREYCVRRMNGEGRVEGSVQGGGIYRELTVTVPERR